MRRTPSGSEAHALSGIDEHGALSQNDLAHHLALAKSTVSPMVDQLDDAAGSDAAPATTTAAAS